MGNLVSRKKKRAKAHVTDQDRAVLDLKNSRDRLTRYQKRLDTECDKLQAKAVSMVKEGRKDRALLLLKVKRLKQAQADKATSQLLSVHQLMETIDWETQQLKVFDALKEGNLALNKLHEEMPLDKVEELMADTAESIAMEEEISKAIGGSWTDANEDDLLAELAELEKEEEEEPQAAAVPAAAPAGPAATPTPAVSKPAEAVVAPEPVAEEPVAELPVAEESVAEEPVAEEPGPSLEDMLPEAPSGPIVVDPVLGTEDAEEEDVEERPALVAA